MGRRHLGQLVNPAGPRASAQVERDSWSTPRGFRHGPEALGTTGQHRVASGTVRSCRGQMVSPTGPRIRARIALDTFSTMRYVLPGSESPGTTGRPWSLGPGPESPGKAGHSRRPSDTGTSRAGQLINPAGSRTQARVALGVLVDTAALRPKRKSRGPSGTVPSHPGKLVDTAGHWARARVAVEGWSTPRDIGPEHDSPRRAGPNRGPSDLR